jgi:hypothetical protein
LRGSKNDYRLVAWSWSFGRYSKQLAMKSVALYPSKSFAEDPFRASTLRHITA